MSISKTDASKKSTNPLVFVGIGCLVLVVVLGIASSFVMKFFAKKIGTGIVQNVIENKTGVKTDLQDLENGKVTFTDEKTGTSIDIGSNKIPASFPKDFPIYTGMKLLSSMSGSGNENSAGFWLTFTTADSFKDVSSYYKTALSSNGWKETASYTAGDTVTTTLTKGVYSGTLSISRESGAKETSIVIMLGDEASSSESN